MTTATSPRAAPARDQSPGPQPSQHADPVSPETRRDAWAALAPAAAGLQQSPERHELRLALAVNLAHLGLMTLAGATLAALPGEMQNQPRAKAVRELIAAAPDDLLPAGALEATCRGNVEAMGDPGGPAGRALEAWAQRMRGEQWYAASDGNVVRRDRDESRPSLWRGLSEQKHAAEAFAAKLAQAQPLPITLEGADPPWLLAALATAAARADGHLVRVNLVQADPLELLDGLALVDLRQALASGRVEVFSGPEATSLLGARLRQRMDMNIKGVSIGLPGIRTPAAPPVAEALEQAAAAQLTEGRAMAARIAQRYAGRDRAWWARRYREARDGGKSGGGGGGSEGGGPLRVLLPACRYSTFVRHASRALADSFERAGCRAEVLIEPDDFSNLSTVAYLRAIDRLEPDAIVLINYTRASMGPALPQSAPVVTWIQDAMAHLLDPAVGAKQGELDFLVGHLLSDLFDRFGYPRARALGAPVVADPAKFHDGPVAPELRQRFECEVALVSHHGEAPEALHARLVSPANADPRVARLCEALRPRIETIVSRAREASPYQALRAAIADEAEALEPSLRSRAEAIAFHQYALPMADRILRHETLAWAAELCEREGWRLRVYGRGWQGGAFDAYARGEVPHGEELRACYRSAAAHLHASINTAVHQRVMECALSGGLPLVRLQRGLVYGQFARAHAAVAQRGGMNEAGGKWGALVADHPEYLAAAAQLQRLGYPVRPRFQLLPERHRQLRQQREEALASPEATELLGDLSVCGFLCRQGLEARLRQAIERPAWRAAVGAGIASRVRARWTTDVLAGQIVRLVGEGLE
jgi:hypothetical protein